MSILDNKLTEAVSAKETTLETFAVYQNTARSESMEIEIGELYWVVSTSFCDDKDDANLIRQPYSPRVQCMYNVYV